MRLAIILIVELLVSFWIYSCAVVDDWALMKARADWHKYPSPETHAALDRAGRIARWKGFAVFAALFGIMAVPTIPLVVMLERRKSKHLQ